VTLLPTPSQTVGPFFAFALCRGPDADLVEEGSDGVIALYGRVLDGAGDGVPDAMVELWQPDGEGRYRPDFGWGRSGTDAGGGYGFTTIRPGAPPGQAPCFTLLVFARGLLKPVLTRAYLGDAEEANAADPVLSALEPADRATLLAEPLAGDYRFDVRLQGPRQTVFFAHP
jgi:protocatechuate 3,4-dioxygenase alpha subunit